MMPCYVKETLHVGFLTTLIGSLTENLNCYYNFRQ